MTMPAGLVKLTTHAPGARSATVSASRTISGIVRSAKQMPPGPVVSCPSTPSDERHRLVDHAALEPPDADGGEDEVGALDGVVEVGRGAERQLHPALLRQAAQDPAHPLHAAGVEVVEHDLVERERVPLRQQRPVDERDAEPAAADDRELH